MEAVSRVCRLCPRVCRGWCSLLECHGCQTSFRLAAGYTGPRCPPLKTQLCPHSGGKLNGHTWLCQFAFLYSDQALQGLGVRQAHAQGACSLSGLCLASPLACFSEGKNKPSMRGWGTLKKNRASKHLLPPFFSVEGVAHSRPV